MRRVTFDNLIFRTDPDGVSRARYGFGKFQLSVILEPGKKLYEAAIFDEQKNFVQLPGIHRIPEDEDDFVDDSWVDEEIRDSEFDELEVPEIVPPAPEVGGVVLKMVLVVLIE